MKERYTTTITMNEEDKARLEGLRKNYSLIDIFREGMNSLMAGGTVTGGAYLGDELSERCTVCGEAAEIHIRKDQLVKGKVKKHAYCKDCYEREVYE